MKLVSPWHRAKPNEVEAARAEAEKMVAQHGMCWFEFWKRRSHGDAGKQQKQVALLLRSFGLSIGQIADMCGRQKTSINCLVSEGVRANNSARRKRWREHTPQVSAMPATLNGQCLSFTQIGAVLGMSAKDVCKVHNDALRKLSEHLHVEMFDVLSDIAEERESQC